MQRQYSGTLGRVDNCQIGTFLAYVNCAADRVLIGRELYIPEEIWFGDPGRCAEAGPRRAYVRDHDRAGPSGRPSTGWSSAGGPPGGVQAHDRQVEAPGGMRRPPAR